jgi:hypothetical protein
MLVMEHSRRNPLVQLMTEPRVKKIAQKNLLLHSGKTVGWFFRFWGGIADTMNSQTNRVRQAK